MPILVLFIKLNHQRLPEMVGGVSTVQIILYEPYLKQSSDRHFCNLKRLWGLSRLMLEIQDFEYLAHKWELSPRRKTRDK